MAFDTTEKSVESGEPVELYTFNFGGTDIYRLTSHDVDVVFNAFTYTSESIKRTTVEVSKEDEINNIELTMPNSHAVPLKYVATVPGRRGVITIVKTHVTELGGAEDSVEIFQGFVASVKFVGRFEAVVKCKPISSMFKRSGPRFQYTSLCNHVLYDARCKLNRTAFRFNGTVTAISGDIITVNGAGGFDPSPTYFQGGYAEFPVASNEDFRLILEQTGDNIRLLLPFAASVLGSQVSLFAGCAHDIDTCDAKFSNAINFGGAPYVPRKNPFSGELR